MPIRAGQTQLALVPPYEKWALDLLTRADYDDYWKHPSLNPRVHWDRFPEMPILFVGGWYDSYTRATFQNFAGLQDGGRRTVRALVGPWTHGAKTVELSHAGDVEFGRDAALPSFDEVHLRWFDRWLRGVDNGLDARGAAADLRDGWRLGPALGRRDGSCTAAAGATSRSGRWPGRGSPSSTCTATGRSGPSRRPRSGRPRPTASIRTTRCRRSAATSRPCGTCCRCRPASPTRATSGAASGRGTSWRRAASTSARRRSSTAASRRTCRSARARTCSSSRPRRCRRRSR